MRFGRLHPSTIISGEPNELVAQIHTRMPVVLPETGKHKWSIVLHRDCVWDLSANHLLPLVKGIHRNQTAPFL